MDEFNSPDFDQVDAILAEYLRRIDSKEMVDRVQFLKAHHDVATELRDYFASEDLLRRLIQRVPLPIR